MKLNNSGFTTIFVLSHLVIFCFDNQLKEPSFPVFPTNHINQFNAETRQHGRAQ